MKIIIIGDGKVGYSLAENLSKEDNSVVILSSFEAKTAYALKILGCADISVWRNDLFFDVQKKIQYLRSRCICCRVRYLISSSISKTLPHTSKIESK